MTSDPTILAAAYVLLSTVLGALLFFAWAQNQKIHALAWWSATFCLIPFGIGMANLGQGAPNNLNLLVANTFVILGYGALYVGCVRFNERTWSWLVIVIGPVIWGVIFPFIHDTLSARIALLALISGGYAALSAWELSKHASRPLASQRAAIVLLSGLVAFNLFRAMLGLSMGSLFGMTPAVSRWSAEMALLLVIYAPALAFVFLAMAKERTEFDYRKAERALRESEEHYRHSVELNPQISWTADSQAHLLTGSSRWEDLTGMPVDQALGIGWTMALHPEDLAHAQQRWLQSASTGEPLDVEYRVRLVDGSYRWFRARATARLNEDGTINRWYGTLEDVHDARLAADRLHWAAHHDELTGLPNRRLFQDRLRQILNQAFDAEQRVGLLLMDIDDFKQINDQFGHDAGDALLLAFGKRLANHVRAPETVARLGGDEFAVILPDVAGEDEVTNLAKTILGQMREPLMFGNLIRECRASIGGAISAEHSTAAGELLKQADLALYSCKAAGGGLFEMFQPGMRDEAQKRASALEVAHQAIVHDWIVPFYQPKVALSSGQIAGYEALLRWHHPRMGVQSPDALAPAFEDTELGIAIGNRMLTCVLGDMRRWLDAGLNIGRISINASAAEFRRDDYAERVLECLRKAGISPSHLGVEVTETVLLDHNGEGVQKTLRALSDRGISIALDDFGTGYASLTHLKRFPVNVIKIDRSFVSDMEVDAGDAAIVRAVLSLGQSLGIRVVAEGVETAEQASFLRKYGCDLGQGYHFGRPMPAENIPQFLASWMHDAGPGLEI